jgi:hypothetical protein
MYAQASVQHGADPGVDPGDRSASGPSLPALVEALARDALELIALEGRAAALTLALLVFVSVAAGCFALFAWFGLSAVGVVAFVRAGHSLPVALTVLAGINAALAVGAGAYALRLTRSILFGGPRDARSQEASSAHARERVDA